MIAFNGAVAILVPDDDAERTYHDAGPAGHALIRIGYDFSRFRMPGNTARYAGLGAKGILAMPALQGNRSNSAGRIPVVDAFHADPLAGQRTFFNRVRRFFSSGMGDRAGNLAGPAGKTLINNAINTFHDVKNP